MTFSEIQTIRSVTYYASVMPNIKLRCSLAAFELLSFLSLSHNRTSVFGDCAFVTSDASHGCSGRENSIVIGSAT